MEFDFTRFYKILQDFCELPVRFFLSVEIANISYECIEQEMSGLTAEFKVRNLQLSFLLTHKELSISLE
jgi:hypothetical protein